MPVNIYAREIAATTIPNTNLDVNSNLPSDLYNPATGETVNVESDTTNTVLDNSNGTTSGGINLPTGLQQQVQDLTKAINAIPQSQATSNPPITNTCNCTGVFNFLCPLKCFIIDVFSAIANIAMGIGDTAIRFAIGGADEANKFAGLGYTPNDNYIISIGWG